MFKNKSNRSNNTNSSKSTKKRPKKYTKKAKKNELNKEIIGIIIVSIGVLALFSVHNSSTGMAGDFIEMFFAQAAGYGGFIIPYLIITIGILFIFNRFKIDESKKAMAIIIIFICFLVILDINTFENPNYVNPEIKDLEGISQMSFVNRVVRSGDIGELNKAGGGIIGAIFSFMFLNMFGRIGAYIIMSSLILVSILVITNISLVKSIAFISSKLGAFIKVTLLAIKEFVTLDPNRTETKTKTNDKDLEKLIKTEDNPISVALKADKNINDINRKIKVLDYTKNADLKEIKIATSNTNKKDVNLEVENISLISSSSEKRFRDYDFPSLDLLNNRKNIDNIGNKKDILIKARRLESTLENFGINAKITQINKGPVITRFEIQPAPGVKVSKIVGLADDIALGLAASDIRIEAPIPGKSAIGIEVPNRSKINVLLREVLETDTYKEIGTKIPFALGKDITGKPIVANIEQMPHLLIAGATGSGKSVCINTLISSILYKAKPDEVKLLMIDPKVVELGIYNSIPHLLIPVVTEPKKAAGALNWAIQEMTKRYKVFAENSVRDIYSYNKKSETKEDLEKLPQIVIIIDELADLMMVSASEVEDYICRLAQMARAAGIHLIIATQRPSVDVITGTIKANIPSRISFAVSSQPDSRTILGMGGAEKLLGKGDMLYYPVGAAKPIRVQGAFIDEEEVERVVDFLKEQGTVSYKEEIIDEIESDTDLETDSNDELLSEAIECVIEDQQASISRLQRKFRIGYNRAARLIDEMEARGIVGSHEGSKPRKVLVTKEDFE